MNIEKLLHTLDQVRREAIIDFNVADVVIEGRSLFQMGDVRRRDMPQLKGFPIKGSVASNHMEADKNGKVDVSAEFVEWLRRVKGIKTVRCTSAARHLSGSQNELVASKVAKHVHKLINKESTKKIQQLYYTDPSGVLVDGHHGWASVRVYEAATNQVVNLQVVQIMAHIDQILEWAKEYTAAIGIEAKEGV